MGYKTLQLKLKTDYSDDDIRQAIKKQLGATDFSYHIEKKSLDARKKTNIHWQISLVVFSNHFKKTDYLSGKQLLIPRKKRKEKVIVVGSGPAGFFAAHVLQIAGYHVTILERGSQVTKRSEAIDLLQKNGQFSSQNNFAFGEGGAGTFSDGKLTSRSKHISAERYFVLSEYVKAGAPEEILYMAHPHVGTDNLKLVVANLRSEFLNNGGQFLFDTKMENIIVKGDKVTKIVCNTGEIEADVIVLATGNSAYDTYHLLLDKGIQFTTKNFAIGHRVEHEQTLINMAQWGREKLPGVKAAEYRLSAKTKSGVGVYTFCMCPGGTVVPAAAFENRSVVNGMSNYSRNGFYSNAGCVVGVHPDMLLGKKCLPIDILDWMDKLEEKSYAFSNSLVIPANRVSDYINKRTSRQIGNSSYALGLQSAPLYDMVPDIISDALAEGLRSFNNKLKGFDKGVLMGMETKTSSPLRVIRENDGRCEGFKNLYSVGEGSGYAGGIISSAADGIKCAMSLSFK